MIQNTFCILDGIGEKTERKIWESGILSWDDFLDAEDLLGLSRERKGLLNESLFLHQRELRRGNAPYFFDTLKQREHWRLFELFRDHAVCLDIETNGFQPSQGGYVTMVGLYDGYDYKCFLHGRDLTAENLSRELSQYKCLITFYGACFDVPFLLRTFSGVQFNIPHFDLCFASKRLGIQGGLKRIETYFGIERDCDTKGLNGYDAVKLWESAKRGSSESLDLLVKYNREDTVNLMEIASQIYERLRQATGIEAYISCGVA